jgi:hypothetical protein
MLVHFLVADMFHGGYKQETGVVVLANTAFSAAVAKAKKQTATTTKRVTARLVGPGRAEMCLHQLDWAITFEGLKHHHGFDATSEGNIVHLITFGTASGG